MQAVGITGYGGYVPRLRLERAAVAAAHTWFDPALRGLGKGQRAMANWDEDSITMAVAAARDCLPNGAEPKSLLLASTTHPFKDRQNSVLVKEALNLSDTTTAADIAGSRRAGTTALRMALESARGGTGEVLCLAAEKLRPKPASEAEFFAGDGAAALLLGMERLGTENLLAEFIGSYTDSVDFVDHFRQADAEFDYTWESRWIRDQGYGKLAVNTVQTALANYQLTPEDIDHFIFPAPLRGASAFVAKKLGLPETALYPDLHPEMGNAGTAQPLITLAHCLGEAKPGACIAVVGFGQGCEVLLFRVTEAITNFRPRLGVAGSLAQGKSESNYFKYLVFNNLLPIEKGMRAEMDQKTPLTALYRDRKAVLALVGGRCRETGAIQFPKTRISVDTKDGAVDTQEDYRFADIPASILTFTADRLAYSIDPPSYYGNIEFAGGGRMVADFTDMDPEDAEVGRAMRMEFRIKALDEQRGFTRYFWKAVPVRV